ncbi:putative Bax inhibitor 1 [Porphyridium purpureum]|uniref:Putative Bax inhibitor 1 n=1 Tax=Porphyridium purpureum TaxID=35688 RepID=A0A5J4Z937_PORPP|nr:putative Bax inhibitor 1 [Porphyridium purpureum]|eukprot:POR9407..scf295_1
MSGMSFDMGSLALELPPHVRYHVKSVYSALAMLLAAMACGLGVNLYVRLPNILMAMSTFGSMVYFSTIPASPQNLSKRTGVLLLFAFCSGASLALLGASEYILFVAVTATAIMFACFSGAALFAKRRSYLYLGAVLSSAMSMMFWFGMASWMFPNRMNYLLQLYGGLLLFSGYVVYDTQLIVERACSEEKPDVLSDAMKLFMDFVAMLRRVIIILMERERSKKSSSQHRGAYSHGAYSGRPGYGSYSRGYNSYGSGRGMRGSAQFY